MTTDAGGSGTSRASYGTLLADARRGGDRWDVRLGELLAQRWCAEYQAQTPRRTQILEVGIARLTYLFDAAPSLAGAEGDDRVVGVSGWASAPARARDRSRMRGLIPEPRRWSGMDLDRGHFVAHAAGGGTDLNLFPQARVLNRGWSAAGRRWRALERETSRDGTFLFIRPVYTDPSWVPAELEAGYVRPGGELVVERFANR
jgi:hypothetical protein